MVKSARDVVRKRWEALCVEWQQSGVSQKAFCAKRGVDYKAFSNWRGRNQDVVARIAAQGMEATPSTPYHQLVPLQVMRDDLRPSPKQVSPNLRRIASPPINITTCHGHKLQVEDGFNEHTLLRVLRTLKEAA
ncbi:MAG: hypothetical protein Q7K57_44915 [Burkholderiaceae bacterium]|nr:hypothetical protein [Burkholderiaceae bacterium]